MVEEQGRGCHSRYANLIFPPKTAEARLMTVVAHGDILRWIADGQSQGHMSSRVRSGILLSVVGANL